MHLINLNLCNSPITYANSEEPKPGVVPENLQRIDHKQNHNNSQRQRVDVRRYAQTGAVQEAEQAQRPDDPKNGRQLHQVLLRQVIPRVQLKNQDVVHSGRSPSVNVDADEEEEFDDEEWTPVEFERHFQVLRRTPVEYCWKTYFEI